MPHTASAPRSALGTLALSLTMLCVIGAPLALGARHPRPVVGFTILALIALAFHISDRIRQGRAVKTSWLGLPIFLGALFNLAMLIPLPRAALSWLSAESYTKLEGTKALLPPASASKVLSVLSLDPPQTAARLLQLIAATCIFLVISDRARSKREQKTIFFWILCGGALLVSVAIGHRFLNVEKIWGIYQANEGAPFYAPMHSPNHLSKVFGVFALLCLAGALYVRNKYQKFAFCFCAALCGMSVPLAPSRGGTLVFLLSLGGMSVLALLHSRRETPSIFKGNNYVPWFLIMLVWSALASLYVAHQAIFREFETLSDLTSITIKTDLYKFVPSILRHHWLNGIGSGSLVVDFFAHHEPRPETSFIFSGLRDYYYMENILLQTLVDHGVLKGAILLAICGWVLLTLFKKYFRNLKEQTLVVALFLVFVGDLADYSLEIGAQLWLVTFVLGLCASDLAQRGLLLMRLEKTKMFAIQTSCFLLGLVFAYPAIAFDREHLEESLKQAQISDRQRLLETMIAKHPFDAHDAYYLAFEARRVNDLDGALSWSKHAVLLRPTHFGGHMELAKVYVAQSQFEKAIDEYRRAAMSKPSRCLDVVEQAALLSPSQAIRMQVLPDLSANNYVLLCIQLEREGRINEAQRCFNQAASFGDADEDVVMKAAQHAIRNGRKNSSLKLAKQLLGDDQPDGTKAVILAQAMALEHGKASVLEMSDAWLEHAKEPCPLIMWRGKAANAIGHLDPALESIKFLQECPEQITSVDLELWKSEVLRQKGQPAKALEVLQSLARARPTDANVMKSKLGAELRLGKIADAEETYRLFSQLQPDDQSLAAMRDQLVAEKNKKESERLNQLLQ